MPIHRRPPKVSSSRSPSCYFPDALFHQSCQSCSSLAAFSSLSPPLSPLAMDSVTVGSAVRYNFKGLLCSLVDLQSHEPRC